MKITLPAVGRFAVTLTVVALAILVGHRLWTHYEVEPWTRDGRVKANVVQVAPDVTGQVVKMYVRDNQQVKAGQPLFDIDSARFELALRTAEAAERAPRAALAQAQKEAERNIQLKDLVAQEVREQGNARVDQARAALEGVKVAGDLARLNLARTHVVSAVNGTITNLDLQLGTYVSAGRPVMAMIDNDSFYVEGYFEETKLPRIQIGDPVTIALMGQQQMLAGHVDSFSGGIADRDRSTSANLLPNVNPTFNWVRLAQRIPVRVAIDSVPAPVRLIAGQTVTVEVHPNGGEVGSPRTAARTRGAP
ncbi:MAG: efflux RND transporter periplasmic adaptor subunit [Janthinobacterium lividum]